MDAVIIGDLAVVGNFVVGFRLSESRLCSSGRRRVVRDVFLLLSQYGDAMNRRVLVPLILCISLASCSDEAADQPSPSKAAPPANPAISKAPDIHYPHEAYLSVDPDVAVPAVEWAVENNRGNILESVWLRANCPEARKIALRHFLRLETSSPEDFVIEVREIARNADERIREIEEVASEFERHRQD